MVTTDTGPRAVELRNAVACMTVRYGLSMQRMAYAKSDGRREGALRHRRAGRRQFAAVQRLANSLAELPT